MHKWKAYGRYVTTSKDMMPFEVEVELNCSVLSEARSIIKNNYIKDILKKSKNDFVRVYEMQLEDAPEKTEGNGGDGELEELVLQASNLGCLPVNYSTYRDDATRKRQIKIALNRRQERVDKQNKKESPNDFI